MSGTNNGWNGSTCTIGGAGMVPLTDLHAPDDPADFDTTGSLDTTHLHGTGKHKDQVTGSFLGSKFPVAGKVFSLAFSIGAPTGSAGTRLPQLGHARCAGPGLRHANERVRPEGCADRRQLYDRPGRSLPDRHPGNLGHR